MTQIWPPETLPATVHATAVSLSSKSVLILGESGRGKSSFAFQLLAMGGHLISDDLVLLTAKADHILTAHPRGPVRDVQIEARGLGILTLPAGNASRLGVIVDLNETETDRLPEPDTSVIAGHAIRRLKAVDNPAFPAMVHQYLLHAVP